MLAYELMTSSVITVTPQLPIREAARELDLHDISSMPVVDGDGRLLGMISESDVLRGRVARDPLGQPPRESWSERPPRVVGDVMSVSVVSVVERTDAAVVARTLLDLGLRAVPVVRGDVVVGIVSRRDLIRALATTDDEIQRQVEHLLGVAELEGWTVEVADGVVVIDGAGGPRDQAIALVLARTVSGVTAVQRAGDSAVDGRGAGPVETAHAL